MSNPLRLETIKDSDLGGRSYLAILRTRGKGHGYHFGAYLVALKFVRTMDATGVVTQRIRELKPCLPDGQEAGTLRAKGSPSSPPPIHVEGRMLSSMKMVGSTLRWKV